MISFDNLSPYKKQYKMTNPVYPTIVKDTSMKWVGNRLSSKVDLLTPFENGYKNYTVNSSLFATGSKPAYTRQEFDSIYDRYIPGLSHVRYKEEPIGESAAIRHIRPRFQESASREHNIAEDIRIEQLAGWYYLPLNNRPPESIKARSVNLGIPADQQNFSRRPKLLKSTTYSLLRGDKHI
uniref:Uncharacterized protein n=1 Tax=viral metagenome TaxID=1070528 RepID=A0A6C0JBB4_9ZZZZ